MAEETMNDFMDEIDKSLAKGKDGDGFIWDKLHELLDSGEYVDVEVTEAVKGGVVAFLEEKRGFIPASKLSLSYIDEEKLPEFVGKTLKVKVITVDEEEDKLVLSAKDYLKEEAEKKKAEAIAKVQVGLVTEGVVESIQNYGAFVKLENGTSGLLHISQICNQRIAHPSAVLKVGQTVKVKVTAIKDGKLSLSMKALEEIGAEEVTEEKIEFESEGEATTSLADLLKKAGF
ncbi:MAG: S1 RNA-binding domain-containing protein [Butyrivibrio sp.]|nr:S1 RNA-binding domain-containing protein [Butyrivibrio sp.]